MAQLQPIQFKRSSVAGRIPTDSDILVGEIAINLVDRKIFTKTNTGQVIELAIGVDYDSDVAQIYHDFSANDSDLWVAIRNVLLEHDSDNVITRADHDSDLAMTYHDFRASDSDFKVRYDSDIAVIYDTITTTYHDYRAADSDLRVDIDSDGVTIRHDYQAADSDLRADIDSDSVTIRHDYQADDSDIRTLLFAVVDSDLTTIRHDYRAADSDLRADIDSDSVTIRHDYQAADSDMTVDTLRDTFFLYKADAPEFIDSELVTIEVSGSDDPDLNGVWETGVTNVINFVQRGFGDRYVTVLDVNDKHIYFRKHISGNQYYIITKTYDSDFRVTWHEIEGSADLFYNRDVEGITGYAYPRLIGSLVYDESGLFDLFTSGRVVGNSSIFNHGYITATFNEQQKLYRTSPLAKDNSVLVYDSESRKWISSNIIDDLYHDILAVDSDAELARLKDVDVANPKHEGALVYDSDQGMWVAGDPLRTYTAFNAVEHFTGPSLAGQTQFDLLNGPKGEVQMFRNGVILKDGVYDYDTATQKVNYYPELNNGDQFEAEDDVIITYIYSSAVTSDTRLADLTDVQATALDATHYQGLAWDSDVKMWVPKDFKGAILTSETFTATQGQDVFSLAVPPKGTVNFFRNGVLLPSVCVTVDGADIVYDLQYNDFNEIDAGDLITIAYLGVDSLVGVYDSLNQLRDVSVNNAPNGSILYKNTNGVWSHLAPEIDSIVSFDTEFAFYGTTMILRIPSSGDLQMKFSGFTGSAQIVITQKIKTDVAFGASVYAPVITPDTWFNVYSGNTSITSAEGNYHQIVFEWEGRRWKLRADVDKSANRYYLNVKQIG